MAAFGIKTGYWVDWTHGSVYGPSITLSSQTSNFVIAIASLWVGSLIAGWAWSIFAILVYHYRSRSAFRDGIHVQHQLIWRNVGDPLNATIEIFNVYKGRSAFLTRAEAGVKRPWMWLFEQAPWTNTSFSHRTKRTTPKAHATSWHHAQYRQLKRRTCVAAGLPLAIWAGFFVAGIFVSRIAKAQHDVLLSGNLEACGIWQLVRDNHGNETREMDAHYAFAGKVLRDTLDGQSYARSCYSDNTGTLKPLSCSFFTKQSLEYVTGLDGDSCPFKYYPEEPFDTGPCNATRSVGTFVMFTRILDSNDDLGINAPEHNSIGFQKSVNCSVLSLHNRTGHTAGLETQTNATYATYLFGSVQTGLYQNVTYFLDVAASQSNQNTFQINAFHADAGGPYSGWTPSPPFLPSNGDVSLYLLVGNDVLFTTPVTDPFFLATDPQDAPDGYSEASLFYTPVNPVSALACIDQYTICNSSKTNRNCTEPGGKYGLDSKIAELRLSPTQFVTAKRIISIFSNTDTFSSVYGAGTAALKASNTVLGIVSLGLPSNQWEIEVEGWFQTSLAKMQAYAVEFVNNTEDLGLFGVRSFPDADETTLSIWKAQCKAQRIANPGGYQTFSFLALILLLCIGLALCVTAFLAKVWASHHGDPSYVADDKLHLQRMVLGEKMISSGDDYPVYDPTLTALRRPRDDNGNITYLVLQPIVASAQATVVGSSSTSNTSP